MAEIEHKPRGPESEMFYLNILIELRRILETDDFMSLPWRAKQLRDALMRHATVGA